MSFFGNQSVAGSQPSIHHFRVNASQYGSIIPIVYGRARIPGIFIWSGDFAATKGKGPGKGLGGTGGSFYNYSISVEIALAQGPIGSIGRSWHMGNGGLKRHTTQQTNSNWTVFAGNFAQAPWPYLTSKHPGQDLGYTGIALLARSAWNLGTTGSPPQITFEVFGLEPYGPGVPDANPSDVFIDMLTNSQYGLNLSSGCIGDLTDFANYCVANNFFISPVFDQQKTMSEWLRMLLDCVHADAVWSNGQFKVVPYGDQPAVANGVTWVPSVGPVYMLTDDDFMVDRNGAPVTMTVTTPSDRANVVDVEYVNAANDYNIETAEAKDEADIQRLGQRRDAPKQFHPITNALMARAVAQLKLQRSLYVANQYQVRVPQRYILAEPMDILGLTDSYLGLSAYPARIVEIEEEADDAGVVRGDSLLITLEDLGENSTPGYPTQPPGPWGSIDQNTAPNAVNTNPLIFEPPAKALANHAISAHLKGSLELWVAASAQDADADWGGCNVYLSADNSTYDLIGRIRNPAVMGTLLFTLPSHADPDTVNTLQVDLSGSGGTLVGVSHALADSGRNMAWVDGELLCFAGVAAGSGLNQFNLTYLRRGRYGTSSSSHASGSNFAFLGAIHALDSSVLRIPLTNAQIGQTLYLKFASVNTAVDAEQDLSTCTAYAVVVTGAGHQNRVAPRHVKKYKVLTGYPAGAYVKPNSPNGFFYQAQNNGTTGGSEPAWPLGTDQIVTDSGGVSWIAVESSPELDPGSIGTSALDDTPLPDPASLSCTVTKKGDLKLAWTFTTPRPSNFSHFEIRSGLSWAGGTFIDTTKRTNYLITDPSPGAATYWVGAINVAQIPDTAPPSIAITMPAPADVTGLSATVTRKGDVLLQWTKPSPLPAHFRAFEIRQGASWATGTLVDHTKSAKYLITDPSAGSTVYWVGVLDESGNYDPAPPSVTATMPSLTDVTGLNAVVTRKGDVQLQWTKPSPLPAHFRAFEIRQGASWAAGTLVDHTKSAKYLITDPSTGSTIYWVGVLDESGNYDPAPPSATATMPSLADVTGLSATITRKGDVLLKWTRPSPFPAHFRAFEIRQGASWATGTLVDHTKTVNYLITDPPPGSTIYWVGMLDESGNYDPTPPSAVATMPALADVGGLSAAITRKGDVLLKWTKPSPLPPHFRAFEIRQGASWASGTLVDHTKAANYLITDPSPGATVYWVGVLDESGNYDPAPPSVTAQPSPPASVGSLAASVTKKQDLKLSWPKPSPFPAHFNTYEIRSGASWNAGTFIAHTKQTQYLISDPAVGSTTYWVGVLDLAGNYDTAQPSVSGNISAGFSLDVIADGDGAGGGTFGKHRLSGLNNGIVKKSLQHLWNGMTPDTNDGNRMSPINSGSPSTGTMTRAAYGTDWEVSFQFELSSTASFLDTGQGDGSGTGGLGHAYMFEVAGNGNPHGIYRWDGAWHGLGTATSTLAANVAHNAILKRHSTGHLELYVNGALVVQVQDTSYGAATGLYMSWTGAIAYVSNIVIRGGHADTPKAYKDTSTKRALIDLTHAHANKSLDSLPDGSTYGRTLVSSLTTGIANRDTQHLFPGATIDPDGKRIQVPTLSTVLASATAYQKDIEIDAVLELQANATLHLFVTNNGSPTGNGYDFSISNLNHCRILRAVGGPGGTTTVLADYGNTTTGIHQVTLRRHHNGKLTLILDGNTLGTVKDTTYTPSSPIYLTQNSGGQCYLSKLSVRGNPTVAADTIDPSTGALTAGSLAPGAATNAGSGAWNAPFGTGVSLLPAANSWTPWTSLSGTISLLVQNDGDIIEGMVQVLIFESAKINTDMTEIRIINDLGTVVATPDLLIAPFTRDANTEVSNYLNPVQAAAGYISFQEPNGGPRTYTIQIRIFRATGSFFNATVYGTSANLRDYAA